MLWTVQACEQPCSGPLGLLVSVTSAVVGLASILIINAHLECLL